MMQKEHLVNRVVNTLEQGGFDNFLYEGCFDVLARKNGQILLIKVLEDANSISRQCTEEMGAIASYINASPLIISEKAGSRLEDNIVYSRFSICKKPEK